MAEDDYTKVCPYCAETIKLEAIVCRYCGFDLLTGQPTRVVETRSEFAAPAVKPRGSTIEDGVRLGFGMFIMLPLIILLCVIVFFAVFIGVHG